MPGGVAELLVALGQIAAAREDWSQPRVLLLGGVAQGWPGMHWLVTAGLEMLARAAVAEGGAAQIVRLWAATTTWCAAAGTPLSPSRRSDYATDLEVARQTLDDQRFAAAWAEGAAWTPEQVVAAATTPPT
jgi:hypothetical protein